MLPYHVSMDKAKKLKHALMGISIVGLSASLYELIPKFAQDFLMQKRDPEVQEFVEEHLEEIIKAQEEKLGLGYPAFPKNIHYLLPLAEKNNNTMGLYDSKTDTIYLQSGRLTTPGFNWGDFFAWLGAGSLQETKATLEHELGHFYCDKLSESLGKGSWRSDLDIRTDLQLISMKLVSEGIAEYFERTMNNSTDKFTDSSWPRLINKFYGRNSYRLFYDGGYHLVKPLLEKHGEKGIIYLMFKSPTATELLDLPNYQKKALKELDDPHIVPELLKNN